MATATKPKKSSSKTTSSKAKTTARGATKPKPNTTSPGAKQIEDVREKRAAFDQPVVDTPLPVIDADGQVEPVDGKCIEFSTEGQTVTLTIGSAKATLDREGILALQRKLSQAAAGI